MLNRSVQATLDLSVLSLSYWLAFLFRFEFDIPAGWFRVLLITWPYVLAIQYLGLSLLSVPRMSWRYISISDVSRIFFAIVGSTAVLVSVRVVCARLGENVSLVTIPLGVLAMNSALSLTFLVGIRGLRRIHGEALERKRQETHGKRHRVLLIGAGQAGVMVAREILNRPDLGLVPVGFLDDNAEKIGASIAGLPVLGATKDVAEIAAQKRVERALITIANAPGQQIRRIAEACRDARIETKIIPGIYEIVGDRVNLSRIREVAIEDLLGRDPVELEQEVVGSAIRSKVVLVTGAGGSIGSELCRQVCRFGPSRIVLVERFENALFGIHRELTNTFPQVPIVPCIADVCDVARLDGVFETWKPEIVFHAAAHKHVPMMEWNPAEAVKNNIGGTRVVAELADRYGVQRFVLISTDKAVNPTSVMGATKRVAEMFVQSLGQRSETRFVTVRFGNVLGSAGSVVPIFRDQIARGGPITITHPEMRRYFMTIPEASQLVLQAGAMGQGGAIYILDMGDPVRIVDLARDLITLSGLKPDEDIEIIYSGLRPGEKLFEELSTDAESVDKTTHRKIYVGKTSPIAWDALVTGVDALVQLAREGHEGRVRSALSNLVPEYSTRPERTSTGVGIQRTEEHVVEDVRVTSRKSGSSVIPN